MAHVISLNSQRYTTTGQIIRSKVDPYAPVVRSEGLQRVSSLVSRQSLILPPPTGGMGLPKILARDIDNPRKLRRSKVSELDTRFVPITLPRQAEGLTEPTNSGDTYFTPRVWTYYGPLLYGIFDGQKDSDDTPYILNASYTGGSWTHRSKTNLGPSGGGTAHIPQGVTQDGNYFILSLVNANDHLTWRSTDLTGAWVAAGTDVTTNQLADVVAQGEDIDASRIVTVPGVGSYIMAWDENNLVVDIFKSTDQGHTWSSDLANAAMTSNGVHGASVYYDLNGDVAPVFVTDDAIYAYDTSAQSVHRLVSLPANANNGKATAVWANPYLGGGSGLYVGLGDGRVVEYLWAGTSGSPSIKILFLNYHGAMDADMQGHFLRFMPTSQWLYGSIGGHSGDGKAWIAAYDGRASVVPLEDFDPSEGWHFMTQHGTANREIDFLAIDPDSDIVFSMRTAATTSDTQYIQNANAPPNGPDTINYESSGVLDRPRIDGGFPHDPGAWIAVAYEADDLSGSTSGEYINLDRGVNAAAPTTDIGNIISSARVLQIASGAGIEGREFQLMENYHRSGTTGNTPKGHDVEIMYRKKTASLDVWRFTVDITDTASQEQEPVATIMSRLQTAQANTILQAFQDQPDIASPTTYYVDVRLASWRDEFGREVSHLGQEGAMVHTVDIELREVFVTG